jgi:hypothetical protein
MTGLTLLLLSLSFVVVVLGPHRTTRHGVMNELLHRRPVHVPEVGTAYHRRH